MPDPRQPKKPSAHSASAEAEEALLVAWQEGHEDALGDLLACFKPRIWSLCYRTLHHYEDAADLTQDAMVRIIKGLPNFDGRSKLSTWIIRVTLNCCLSHLRKQKLRRHQSLDATAPGEEGGSRASRLISGEPPPEQGVERNDQLEQLATAFAGMEGEQRLLLLLRDMHGVEYGQLAEIYEVPVGTIKSRIFRARAALREHLEPGQPVEREPIHPAVEQTRARGTRAT
jgi:RNA polymerase sigma-70 factor (ECF subfamily)